MATDRRRSLTLLPLLALCSGLCVPAQEHRSPIDEPATIRAVAELLVDGHLTREPIDATIAARTFEGLLRAFDPMGLYLLQADVDELSAAQASIAADVRAGRDRLATRLQALLEQRVPEAIEHGLHWLTQPHDFGIDETMRVAVGPHEYAASAQELDDRWRRRIKYDLLVLEGDGVKGDDATSRLRARFERMAERTLLRTPDEIDAAFLEALASSYDPHTSYLPPRAAEDFAIHMRLQYEGIGAVLHDEDGRAVIGELIRGGAAAASGLLQVGDVVQGVGQGETGPIDSVHGLELDEVVDRIRGPRDSVVRLSVTTGAAPARTVELHRRKTELVDDRAAGKVVEQDGSRIGWIDLPAFYGGATNGPTASRDVAALLRQFADEHIDAVVLDLSRNGGGLLQEAVATTGLFLDQGNVVQVRGADGEVERFDDVDPGALWNGPLVVLISRFSASASEIVAGAIVDQGRGIVVGDSSTHGKGTVQSVVDLAAATHERGVAGALKLTFQQFFRPGGDSTQLRGVAADVKLPSFTESIAEGERELPNALPFAHIAPAASPDSAQRAAAMIARLVQASAHRCADDPGFQHVVASNRQRSDWTARKVVPLERQAFATWRDLGVQLRGGEAKGLPKWYEAEVARIARDYAGELRGHSSI